MPKRRLLKYYGKGMAGLARQKVLAAIADEKAAIKMYQEMGAMFLSDKGWVDLFNELVSQETHHLEYLEEVLKTL